MVWGTYLEKNCQMGICLILGDGVKMLADTNHSKCLPGWFGALFLEKDLTTLQNARIGPEKKCPRVPV